MPAKSTTYEIWRDGEDEDTAEVLTATSAQLAAIRYCMREVSAVVMLRGVTLLVRSPGEEPLAIRVKTELSYEAAFTSDIAALDRSAS
jgi:hypothetical protein